jgi:hypothetical protein
MAIPAQNVAFLSQGPAKAGQVLAPSHLSALEVAFVGTATFVLDGSLTSATLNYIDGTEALTFTPSGFLFSVCGGTATVVINSIKDAANANKTATVIFSGAGSNAQTITVAVAILK